MVLFLKDGLEDIDGLAKSKSEIAKNKARGDVIGLQAGREQARDGEEKVEDPDGLGLCEQDEEERPKAWVEGLVQLHHFPSLLDIVQGSGCFGCHLRQVGDATIHNDHHDGHKKEHESDKEYQGDEG